MALEFTGDEKFFLCIGYLQHLKDMAKENKSPISTRVLSEVSARIEEKFTNNTMDETNNFIKKLTNFSCSEIMKDIVNEIQHEGTIRDDTKIAFICTNYDSSYHYIALQKFKKLEQSKFIVSVCQVTGAYDFIIKVKYELKDELQDFIFNNIRNISGFRSSLTLFDGGKHEN